MYSLINHHVNGLIGMKRCFKHVWTLDPIFVLDKNGEYVANQETSKSAIKHAASNKSFPPVLHQLQEIIKQCNGSWFTFWQQYSLCRAVRFNGKYLWQDYCQKYVMLLL